MSSGNVGDHATAMLKHALAGPAHRRDLLAAAGLAQVAVNHQRHVLPLVDAGLLALAIPDHPRSPRQRYLITDTGRQFLAARIIGADA